MSDVFSKHRENKMHWEQGSVYDLAWSSDGSMLTAAGTKGPVRSWRLERGGHKEGEEHRGLSADIERLAWCPQAKDTNILAAAAFEKTVYLWDQRTGGVETRLQTGRANSEISWSHSGQYLMAASREEGLEIFDVARPDAPAVMSAGVDGLVNAARWSTDDRLLFLATHAGTVEVFAWPQMEHITVIPAHAASCSCLGIDPLGRAVATGSADATLELWDTRDFSLVRTVAGFESPVQFTGFSMDGRFMASASDDAEIRIHAAGSGAPVHSVALKLLATALEWHPKNLAFAFGTAASSKTSLSGKASVTIFL
ncbi:hypothetical protein IWW50_003027 [Coemansia erecta]|nr:hypothetical protein IWW50_003027 [Coemansia erecta]